ncbi:MAG: NADH:flavin oxidoreductase/NADH oxidase [Gammaproteobacteria bacterium]|nr:MAG: NADH:flavin oxidoreductase/NADH oxidase [Gammaproteobacteria bacterium]
MTRLFSEFKLRELSFRNRVFVSPMCQYSATDGVPNNWHLVHLGSRAVGGAGLVMVEASGVCPEGRISPLDLGLWNDTQRDAFKPIVQFIKEQGAVAAIQLAHAGRKASVDAPWNDGKAPDKGWVPLAPSALPFSPDSPMPRALTKDEIASVVRQFTDSAQRALDAGFDVVEVHMAHGYLLHEFLSPLTNRRDDDYGGSLENRMRLPLAVAKAVRDLWPKHLPVFVRISATDWVDGGWDLAQSVELSKRLKEIGIDLIDCSSGGLTPDAQIPAAPNFQVPFATEIRKKANIATGAVGLITEPHQAEEIISNGLADVVLMAREFLRSPYWPLHAARRLNAEIAWPRQYLRAKP